MTRSKTSPEDSEEGRYDRFPSISMNCNIGFIGFVGHFSQGPKAQLLYHKRDIDPFVALANLRLGQHMLDLGCPFRPSSWWDLKRR